MAYASNIQAGSSAGIAGRIAVLVASVKTSLHRRKVYRDTLAELGALSSRELSDLGINRSMITRLALEAAYGRRTGEK